MPSKTISTEIVSNKIFFIRGQKVMLDRDLAKLYQVKTIALRQQVMRNKESFPDDFCFQLNEGETNLLVSQFVIPFFICLKSTMHTQLPQEHIMAKILVIRGQKVLLDKDLAHLY